MSYYFKLGFVLLVITVVAGGILAYINSFTAPIIQENQRRTKDEARREVLPDAVTFEIIKLQSDEDFLINGENVFAGKNEAGDVIGYTFLASLYGYSSDVKSMVGVSRDLIIHKIKIISQTETPGLGANCIKQEFQDQFSDKDMSQMKVDKDGGQIISITGATITTRTIANSIRDGLRLLEKNLAAGTESGQTYEETVK